MWSKDKSLIDFRYQGKIFLSLSIIIFFLWLIIKSFFTFQLIKLDADQDGIPNHLDLMPHNHDNEGQDDDRDVDDDNDGLLDREDPFPYDHDNDGIADRDDEDDDNDGILDNMDNFLWDNDNDGTEDMKDWQWKRDFVDKWKFPNKIK